MSSDACRITTVVLDPESFSPFQHTVQIWSRCSMYWMETGVLSVGITCEQSKIIIHYLITNELIVPTSIWWLIYLQVAWFATLVHVTLHLDSLNRDNPGSNLAPIWRSLDGILNSISGILTKSTNSSTIDRFQLSKIILQKDIRQRHCNFVIVAVGWIQVISSHPFSISFQKGPETTSGPNHIQLQPETNLKPYFKMFQ